MKRKLLLILSLVLISVMMFSMCACDKEPQTGEPNTEQPKTSEVKVDEVTQENVAEAFIPSLKANVYYAGSAFYTVEKDENGEPAEYDGWYKVVGYDSFEQIEAQIKKYFSDETYESRNYSEMFSEKEDGLYVSIPQEQPSELYDISSIELVEADGDEYLISIGYGEMQENGNCWLNQNMVYRAVLRDGVLVIKEIVFYGLIFDALEICRPADKAPEEREWIGFMDGIYDMEPRALSIDGYLFEDLPHISALKDAIPQDSDYPQTNIPEEITQENVAEVFIPSLKAYSSYIGSVFYTVEKDENGDIVPYSIEEFSDSGMVGFKVLEYDEFEPIAIQMRKYLSEYAFQCLMKVGFYSETDGDLYIISPQISSLYKYDITNIELLESDGNEYLIAVDCGYCPSDGDMITEVYKSVFRTTLNKGVLVIESFDKGEAYTPEEMRESAPAEDRKWLGAMNNIYGSEFVSISFDENAVYGQH